MKKYILKPGKHQFAPGSAAVHCNENLTDEAAEWYLERYPHIAGLFIRQTSEQESQIQKAVVKIRRKRRSEIINPKVNEKLLTTN